MSRWLLSGSGKGNLQSGKFLFEWTIANCLTIGILAVLSVSIGASVEYSWCDPTLCDATVSHIACNNNGEFHRRCQRDAYELDISEHHSAFLHEHNKRRSFLALGKVPGYYSASRMPTMEWDDELQFLASLNLRTCKLEHDDCHNSYQFKSIGQNLCAVARDRNPNVNVTNLIEEALDLWFNEYSLIDSSYMDSFRVTQHFKDYGHFAAMMVDRITHVGCGIIRYTRSDHPYAFVYHIVCNYASVYALDAKVYEKGYPTSRCRTGRNPYYHGLCSTRERVNPNWW